MSDTPNQDEDPIANLLNVTANNTTRLINVEQQAAATAASVDDARVYMAEVVKNTSWENNARAIEAIMGKAAAKSQKQVDEALYASSKFGTSVEGLANTGAQAIAKQKEATAHLQSAATSLSEARRGVRRVVGVVRGPHRGALWRCGLVCVSCCVSLEC